MDLLSVQRIQVLKGPQGTLYGRNATGGAILVDTIDPGNEWTGNVEATYGRYNDRRGRVFVAGPMSDRVGISISGTLRHTDGFYKKASRTTPGQFDGDSLRLRQESLRVKLKFDVTDAFRATLGYNFIHALDPRGVMFTPIENVALPYTSGTGRETRPTQLGEYAGDYFDLTYRQHEGSLKLELDTGIGKQRSITGYSRATNRTFFDFGGSYSPDGVSGSVILDKTWQQSIDYSIDAIKNVDLVIGGNYYNITSEFSPTNNTNWSGPAAYLAAAAVPNPATTIIGFPDPAYRVAAETAFFRTKEAWAVFANATFHASERLSVTVGGRYSKEKQDVSGYKINYCSNPASATAPNSIGCTLGAIGNVPYTVDGRALNGVAPLSTVPSARTWHYNKFTPSASIRLELSPGSNIYASYSKGFRAGEWNSVLPADNPNNWVDAKQESVDAYEIGFKTARHGFRAELAGFYYDYRDLQVSNTQAIGFPPVAQVIVTNAPRAKIYGIDASFEYKANDNLTVRGGATWLHARYGDRFVLTGTGVNPVAAGNNVNSDPLTTFQNATAAMDLSGLQMARAPNFTGFFGFDYNIPKGDGGIRISANVKYTSSYVVTNPSIWGCELLATYLPRLNADPTELPNNQALLAGTAYASRSTEQRARQTAFAQVNASITWTDPSDSYFVRLWGNNLTNVKYRTHYNPLVGSGTYQPIGEPFTFGGSVGFKF